MTALTVARSTVTMRVRSGDLLRIPMAADAIIFVGGLVNVDSDGYAVPASDTAGHKFAGLAMADPQDPTATHPNSKYDNYGGDAGAKEVIVLYKGRVRFYLADRTPLQNMLFAKVYIADDQTVAVCREDVTNDIWCGQIMRLPGTTLAAHPETDIGSNEVEIEFGGTPYEWLLGTTTAAPTTTTTTAQA